MKFLKSIISAALAVLLSAAFIPCASAGDSIKLGVNALNAPGAEGQSLILTRKSGRIIGTGSGDYSWWKTATFEYSDTEKAYVVTGLSLYVSGSTPKNNYIPEDGFVLLVNLGNDYGSVNYVNKLSTDTYNALDSVKLGDTAYVTGMDLSANTIDKSSLPHYDKNFTSNAAVYIGSKPEGVAVYEPERDQQRLSPVVANITDNEPFDGEKDLTFTWEAVSGATGYLINVNDSTVVDDGAAIAANIVVTDTSYTIPASKLTVGYTYTVSISATAEGYRSSFTTRSRMFAVSEAALNSPFSGKKIVCFGDSITAFTGWVKMLGGELGTNVINAGYGGDTTKLAIARIDKDVISLSPDIVIMMFGMNDQAIQLASKTPLISLTVYERNYRSMIEKMLKNGIDVVLMTGHEVCNDSGYYVPGEYGLDYGTGEIDKYYDVIRKLAAEYSLNLIDLNSLCANEKSSEICASGDGIHLSTYGHKKYSEWISSFMLNSYVKHSETVSQPESEAESAVAESSAAESTDAQSATVSQAASTAADQEHAKLERGIFIAVSVALLGLFAYLAFSRSKKKKS